MGFIIGVLTVLTLIGTHIIAFKTGYSTGLQITEAKLREAIMLELKNEQKADSERENTK